MSLLRWLANRLKDLFYGPGNVHLDLGRVVSFIVSLAPVGAAIWNARLGKEINLQDFGLGIAAVVTACAVLIAAKDAEKRKAAAAAEE